MFKPSTLSIRNQLNQITGFQDIYKDPKVRLGGEKD